MTNMITIAAPRNTHITVEGLENLLMCVEQSLDLETLLRQFETISVEKASSEIAC